MTPASISQWLQQPHQDLDPQAVQDLLDRYPYFTPLHYMAAALKQEEGRPVVLTGYVHLYRGNPVLLHLLLQAAAARPEEALPQAAPAEQQDQAAPEAAAPGITEQNESSSSVSQKEAPLIQPVFSEDYFLHQGIAVDDQLPEPLHDSPEPEAPAPPEDPKSLMVVMSFTEWLMFFRSKSQKEKEDEEDRKAVKHMWQKEKLAAALEEEDDEIPENVFEMAVNSISKEDGLVSESLAEVLARQGKWEKAIEMYRKLSLRNPQKSAYFAQQIATIQKQSQ